MENLHIGRIIDRHQERDAIHIAVVPMIAGEDLNPGDKAVFKHGITDRVYHHWYGEGGTVVGVVDPFLNEGPKVGQRFWLFLYPGSITSLRHEWTHPSFPLEEAPEAPAAENPAKQWLQEFAETAGLSYARLMEGAKDYLENGEYMIDGGRWEGFSAPDEFWLYYEAVTGERVEHAKRGSFFSCSC